MKVSVFKFANSISLRSPKISKKLLNYPSFKFFGNLGNFLIKFQPKELAGSTLTDLINWLIHWTSRPETEARHKSMEMIPRLTSKERLKTTFRNFVVERHNNVKNYLASVDNCGFDQMAGIGKFREPVCSFTRF